MNCCNNYQNCNCNTGNLSENNDKLKRELGDFVDLLRERVNDIAYDKNYQNIVDSIADVKLDLNNAIDESLDIVNTAKDDVDAAVSAIPFEDGVLSDTFVTATANGVGAVARTQRDKNADTVTLKDFGAKGDGVTDDTESIKKALAYSSDNKVKILVTKGRYLYKSTDDVIGENVSLLGSGGIIDGDGSSTFGDFNSNLTIDGVVFENFNQVFFRVYNNNTPYHYHNISITNCTFRYCNAVTAIGGHASDTRRITNMQFSLNTVVHCGSGLQVTSLVNGYRVIGNFISNLGGDKLNKSSIVGLQPSGESLDYDYEVQNEGLGVVANNVIRDMSVSSGNPSIHAILAYGVDVLITSNIVQGFSAYPSMSAIPHGVYSKGRNIAIHQNIVTDYLSGILCKPIFDNSSYSDKNSSITHASIKNNVVEYTDKEYPDDVAFAARPITTSAISRADIVGNRISNAMGQAIVANGLRSVVRDNTIQNQRPPRTETAYNSPIVSNYGNILIKDNDVSLASGSLYHYLIDITHKDRDEFTDPVIPRVNIEVVGNNFSIDDTTNNNNGLLTLLEATLLKEGSVETSGGRVVITGNTLRSSRNAPTRLYRVRTHEETTLHSFIVTNNILDIPSDSLTTPVLNKPPLNFYKSGNISCFPDDLAPVVGTTSNRPDSVSVGFAYFDTTLGKPIYFKSAGVWVDSTGETV